MASVIATHDAGPLTQFRPFPRLPSELRLKIWRLSFTPRFVGLRRRQLQPNGEVILKKHPYKDIAPAVLLVCHEALEEGLKFYKSFKGYHFSSKLVNLEIDTLHFAECHSGSDKCTTRSMAGWWEDRTPLTYLNELAIRADDVKNITSLAFCSCQIPRPCPPQNRKNLAKTLQNYDKLVRITVAHVGTGGFMEALSEGDWKPSEETRRTLLAMDDQSETWMARSAAKKCMALAALFRIITENLSFDEGALVSKDPVPSEVWKAEDVSCAVVVDGKAVWKEMLLDDLVADWTRNRYQEIEEERLERNTFGGLEFERDGDDSDLEVGYFGP